MTYDDEPTFARRYLMTDEDPVTAAIALLDSLYANADISVDQHTGVMRGFERLQEENAKMCAAASAAERDALWARAYADGWRAHIDGCPQEDNPHKFNSEGYRAWWSGWMSNHNAKHVNETCPAERAALHARLEQASALADHVIALFSGANVGMGARQLLKRAREWREQNES